MFSSLQSEHRYRQTDLLEEKQIYINTHIKIYIVLYDNTFFMITFLFIYIFDENKNDTRIMTEVEMGVEGLLKPEDFP